MLRRLLVFILVTTCSMISFGQESNQRAKTVLPVGDSIVLDSMSIYPSTLRLSHKGKVLDSADYDFNFGTATVYLKRKLSGPFQVEYRVMPYNMSKVYKERDVESIEKDNPNFNPRFTFDESSQALDLFQGSGINKSGSISRGITFGNSQNLGVNSSLNLELSGDIAPNLKLLASVSDDNLPIQAEGNTNSLKEFDQVFIQIYNDRLKLIAGDFWLKKPKGYFLNYNKRAQGLTVQYQWNEGQTKIWKTEVSGALSKGKFNRQIIQGNEGNQGPYRLRGAENEPFIIVLSGTEKVFVDGKMLERGQNYDYTINYNTAEIIFTSRNLITKDSRIVVEFQYSDQNYARSLLQTSTTYSSDKFNFWLNGYSEQDAKNQSLQQTLTPSQKFELSLIGDTLDLARINSIDSVGFSNNQNLYKLVSINGFDSVLVHSVSVDSAVYRATFEFVGSGRGDYVFSNYNALGKVFKWVEPINGVAQGDYEPSRVIITPKQQQMVTTGFSYLITPKLKVTSEFAYTKNDINTFSKFDAKDDRSFGATIKLEGVVPLSRDTNSNWSLKTLVDYEGRDRNFMPIQQYRTVEFDRDWNTRGKGYTGNQASTRVGLNFVNRKKGNVNIEGGHYLIGKNYQGLMQRLNGKWNSNGFSAIWEGSYLNAQSDIGSEFIRHKVDISQDIKYIKIGYKDDHETNKYRTDFLNLNSYQFYDYQFYIANSDSIENEFKVFYRERYDKLSDSTRLRPTAKATSIGGEMRINTWKNQQLNVIGAYRELRIQDTVLSNLTPENTVLGRVEHEMKIWKGALTLNTYYEIGSGLELRREFLYIEVNAGQGIYTWIDYNGDGIKDLNEFEIAQFQDQANFIRVFTPSNEYTKTFSNEYNQSIFWRPERIWSNEKGVKKFLSRFSNQARARIYRKTNFFDANEAFNPFYGNIRDSNLVSTTSNIKNTLYFNRTSSIVGAQYVYQNVSSKTLLASGFDSRSNAFHEVSVRWNIAKKFTIKTSGKYGEKSSGADYTSGRNFRLDYYFIEPSLIFQPNTIFRISLDGRISNKTNDKNLGDERSQVLEIGTKLKFNQAEKGSLQAEFNVLSIKYNGLQNSALGFEMLEGLKTGINYTWSIGYQRSVSKNLQLSIQYNGRKSEGNKFIHAGGMEVRAFF